MMFGTGLAIRERFGNFRMDYLDMSHIEGEEKAMKSTSIELKNFFSWQ